MTHATTEAGFSAAAASAAIKAAPPVAVVGGSHIMGIAIGDVATYLTIFYVMLQVMSLLRNEWPKWAPFRSKLWAHARRIASCLLKLARRRA